MKILNFGSCNIDLVYGVDSIVRAGETISAFSMNQYPGGKGLNQSIALARAGANIYHAGCIGTDGEFLRKLLSDSGADTTYLHTVDARTGHAVIQVDKTGENCIFIYGGANAMITVEQVDSVLSEFDCGDFLLLQNEINHIEYIIKKAHKRGMNIILNPSPFNAVMENIDLNNIAYLILNETEASRIAGTNDPQEFAAWLAAHYSSLKAVLTLGKNGCVYIGDNSLIYQPAFEVKAADTTAAGDTFTGFFIATLCGNMKIHDCLRIASAAAAISTLKEGASPSIPTINEVDSTITSMQPYPDGENYLQKKIVSKYLSEHITDAKLDELAVLLHYSPSYTSRWLKETTGHTFSELLQTERCKTAADYLKNTDMSIHEIIEKIGYSNESFFRNIFCEMYQMLPLDYRRKYKK